MEIILLCGGRNYGKSRTLDELFNQTTKGSQVPYITIQDTIVCTSGAKKSPQETNKFCHYDRVIKEINGRINLCVKRRGDKAILIFAFTVIIGKGKNKGMVNRNCIFEPLKWLKSRGHNVHIVYLRREDDPNIKFIDALMKEIHYEFNIVSRENYALQAKELGDFIDKCIKNRHTNGN